MGVTHSPNQNRINCYFCSSSRTKGHSLRPRKVSMQRAMLLQETAGCPATGEGKEPQKVKHILNILKEHPLIYSNSNSARQEYIKKGFRHFLLYSSPLKLLSTCLSSLNLSDPLTLRFTLTNTISLMFLLTKQNIF